MSEFTGAPFDSIRNMKEFVAFCADRYQEQTAFQYYEKKAVTNVSFLKFQEDVTALGGWLISQGYRQQKIALYGENSYPWLVAHFAATASGNMIVPIDRNLQAEDVEVLVRKSGAAVFLYSSIFSDKAGDLEDGKRKLVCLDELPEILREAKEKGLPCDSENDPSDIAAVVYTSGTTGVSKGVLLTHANLIANARASADACHIEGGNVMALPLHHMLAFTTGVTAVMLYGYPVYINDSIRHINRDIQAAKPQHMVLVPMIVEGLYKTIWRTAEKNGLAKKLRFGLTISNAVSRIGIDVRKKLFGQVLSALGGNLDTIVSGGAPLDEKYIRGFRDLGVTVVNGYGITECSPVVSVNRAGRIKAGTVGEALFCNEIKIKDPDENGIGEVLVSGSNVMAGYLDEPKLTADAFDGSWFRTGDLGRIDDEGFLFITGRIKNLIILSNGENISPEELEEKLYRIEGVKECLVSGGTKGITAEIFPDEEIPDAKNKVEDGILKMNLSLPTYKQIAETIFRETEFDKTTTKKIKRKY